MEEMSLCAFQLGLERVFILLPSIYDVLHHRPDGNSILIVVASLTSLMKDQVDMCNRGIHTAAVTGDEESKQHLSNISAKVVETLPTHIIMIICNTVYNRYV